MDINIYLPDAYAERVEEYKRDGGPLSALFRAALDERLEQVRAFKAADAGAKPHRLELQNSNGDWYTGVLEGRYLADGHAGAEVYLASDGRLLLHDPDEGSCVEVDAEDLRDTLGDDDYIAVCSAVGQKAVVEL